MNRELKFRAWSGTGWIQANYQDTILTLSNFGKSKTVILEQYTGLKDKNGKDIYEGDIVKGDYFKGSWTVFFWEGCFTLKPYATDTMANYNCPYSIEVIGNIHENPDLLKEDNDIV